MTTPRTLSTCPIELPVGPNPGWELDHSDESQDLKSVAESSVVAHSLRHSRERWLFHTFPKFSTKARGGKANDLVPLPHTIQNRGKCDLEIGPHIFPETVFYEVHYLPSQMTHATLPQSPWYTQTGLSMVQKPGGPSQEVTPVVPKEGNTEGSGSVSSSFTAVTPITPSLINQVNSAASSNPILANLLQLAAAGKASPDQLKTLGILIQSLASMDSNATASQTVPATSAQLSSVSQVSSPVREFDLVLEFRETPGDRWLFPRTPVVFERISCKNALQIDRDVFLTVRIPFEQLSEYHPAASAMPSADSTHFQKALMRLRKPPVMVEDTLSRWIGSEEKRHQYSDIIQKLDNGSPVFLSHQISLGTLATQLLNANPTSYTLKPLKQSSTAARATRLQRRKHSERPIAEKSSRRTEEPSKRRQPIRQRTSIATQFRCLNCGQTDVPLILGGRFCRPCVDSGKYAKGDSAQTNPMNTPNTSNLPNDPESMPAILHHTTANLALHHSSTSKSAIQSTKKLLLLA